MKRILLLSLVLCFTINFVEAKNNKYLIKFLNTETITINKKKYREGDTFKDPAVITWESDKQGMKVLTEDNELLTITGAKYKAAKKKNFKDYIAYTKPTSSRAYGELLISLNDHKESLEDGFLLIDSLFVPVGWQVANGAYYLATFNVQNGKANSAIVPSVTPKRLLITSELYDSLTENSDSAYITLYYIEPATNDTTLITDRMFVEKIPLKL